MNSKVTENSPKKQQGREPVTKLKTKRFTQTELEGYKRFIAPTGLSVSSGVSDEGEGWFAAIEQSTGLTLSHGHKSDGLIYYQSFHGSGCVYESMTELLDDRLSLVLKTKEMQDGSRSLQAGWKPILVGKGTGT